MIDFFYWAYLSPHSTLPLRSYTASSASRASSNSWVHTVAATNQYSSTAHRWKWSLFNQHTVHTHTHLTAVCRGLPGWAGTRKVKPIWILLKQETVSGSGISWTICKSAPHSTASKHWRQFYPSYATAYTKHDQKSMSSQSKSMPLLLHMPTVCQVDNFYLFHVPAKWATFAVLSRSPTVLKFHWWIKDCFIPQIHIHSSAVSHGYAHIPWRTVRRHGPWHCQAVVQCTRVYSSPGHTHSQHMVNCRNTSINKSGTERVYVIKVSK